jgi:hypothetical protein
VGGVPELIHPDDHESAMIEQPNAKTLAKRLLLILKDGLRPARPAVSDANVEKTWVVWHHVIMIENKNR